jgi:putative Ca2+/H+ antiporter (TMEM165/GDT1 family)
LGLKKGTDGSSGDWRYLWREIGRRTTQPFSHAPFVFYVLLAILGLGCLGIWVELIKVALSTGQPSYDGVLTALATFFPAMIGSSSLQLILCSTENRDKVLVSFGYFVSIVAFAAVVLISVLHPLLPGTTFWASVIFAVIAVWLWWFTNGDDPTYKSAPFDAASGGNVGRKLKGDIPRDFQQ